MQPLPQKQEESQGKLKRRIENILYSPPETEDYKKYKKALKKQLKTRKRYKTKEKLHIKFIKYTLYVIGAIYLVRYIVTFLYAIITKTILF